LNLLLNLVKHGSTAGEFFGAPNGAGSDRDSGSGLPAGRSSNRWSWFRNGPDHNERDPNTVQNDITKTLEFAVAWQDPTRNDSATMVPALQGPPLAAAAPKMLRLDSGSTLQDNLTDKEGDNGIEDVERQYLGSFGFRRRS
jgi:hypothetical protein